MTKQMSIKVASLVGVCLLLTSLSSTRATSSAKPVVDPIEWWATVLPQNPKYIEIKVVVQQGFCLKPSLPFSVDYFDEEGTRLDRLNESFTKDENKLCAGTYLSYYRVNSRAKSARNGVMSWSLIGSPRPFSGRADQQAP